MNLNVESTGVRITNINIFEQTFLELLPSIHSHFCPDFSVCFPHALQTGWYKEFYFD